MALVVKPGLAIEVGFGVDAVDEAGEVGLAKGSGVGIETQTPMEWRILNRGEMQAAHWQIL